MLETSTHRLRALEPADVVLLHKWENVSSTWWLGSTLTPYSQATLLKFAEGDHEIYQDKQLRLMLDYKDADQGWKTLGAVDLYDFDVRNLRAGVGVTIDETERKNGHALVGLKLLREYSFKHLGLHQLYAEVPADHLPSKNLFHKAEYIECELRKEWVKGTNKWCDVVLFQLLNRD